MNNKGNRRNFMKRVIQMSAIGMTTGNVLANSRCKIPSTPRQPLGPFYPEEIPFDNNQDLTIVDGKLTQAKGKIIILKGVVQDDLCRPIDGAIVEIWQACHTGKYLHASDTSNNLLDPNFQYYGKVKTNKKGEYQFKTILPGKYNATETWVRPPHIHYKVSLRGYNELVTQLYFEGQKENETDRILQGLSAQEQSEVLVNLESKSSQEYQTGIFNIKLEKL